MTKLEEGLIEWVDDVFDPGFAEASDLVREFLASLPRDYADALLRVPVSPREPAGSVAYLKALRALMWDNGYRFNLTKDDTERLRKSLTSPTPREPRENHSSWCNGQCGMNGFSSNPMEYCQTQQELFPKSVAPRESGEREALGFVKSHVMADLIDGTVGFIDKVSRSQTDEFPCAIYGKALTPTVPQEPSGEELAHDQHRREVGALNERWAEPVEGPAEEARKAFTRIADQAWLCGCIPTNSVVGELFYADVEAVRQALTSPPAATESRGEPDE